MMHGIKILKYYRNGILESGLETEGKGEIYDADFNNDNDDDDDDGGDKFFIDYFINGTETFEIAAEKVR